MASKFQFNWQKGLQPSMYQKGMIPSMPEDAARAAYEARLADERIPQGYVPQQTMASMNAADQMSGFHPNALQSQLPEQYDNGSQELYAMQRKLMDEYQRNEARIAEIEAELASIEKAKATNLDDLDMALAANRAGIGDIGNSFAHTSRIQTRRQLAEQAKRDKAINDKKEVEGIVEQLENAYILRGGADNVQRADWDNKINRLSKKYKELTGVDYVYSGATPKTGVVSGTPTNLEEFNSWFTSQPKAKNGYYPKATLDKAKQFLGTFTRSNEVTDKLKEIGNMKSAEKYDSDVEEYKKKANKAIDNAMKTILAGDLKSNESKTWDDPDTKMTVTITNTNGKYSYKVGKIVKVRKD